MNLSVIIQNVSHFSTYKSAWKKHFLLGHFSVSFYFIFIAQGILCDNKIFIFNIDILNKYKQANGHKMYKNKIFLIIKATTYAINEINWMLHTTEIYGGFTNEFSWKYVLLFLPEMKSLSLS